MQEFTKAASMHLSVCKNSPKISASCLLLPHQAAAT
jgi:hypothetical protein